jgi:hypothetical protein
LLDDDIATGQLTLVKDSPGDARAPRGKSWR